MLKSNKTNKKQHKANKGFKIIRQEVYNVSIRQAKAYY